MSVTLADLESVKAETNITSTVDDDELQGYIDAASALLLNHPDYRIADASGLTSYTEWHDSGTDTVMLDHYPVTAVTSVTEYTNGSVQALAAEPVDGGSFTGYGWDYADGTGANGLLVRLSNGAPVRWCGNRVKVEYTAGAASVPADIRLAALALIDHLWESQRGTQGSGLPTGFEDDTPGSSLGLPYGSSFALPNRVRELLEPYTKTPAVA